MPPTNALTATSRANCGQLARRPSRTPRSQRRRERCGHGPVSRGWPVGSGPVRRPADGDREVRVTAPGEQAGGGHRAVAGAAHERDRAGARAGFGAGPRARLRFCAGQRAELDVPRIRQVATGVLGGLPDVQHRAGDLAGPDHADLADRQTSRRPRGHPAVPAPRPGARSRCSAPGGSGLARSCPGSRTNTAGRPGSVSQPSQVANAGRSGIEIAPGMWPAANDAAGRASMRPAPAPARRRTSPGVSAGSAPAGGPSTAGPRRLTSRSRRKYGGYVPRPSSRSRTNSSSLGAAEQRVGRTLGADRGRALRAGRGRAERARAVRRVHRQIVRQREDALVQRPPQCPGQLPGPFRRDQVGPGHRPDQQRPAGEQRRPAGHRRAAGKPCAPGCGRGWPGPVAQPAEIQFVAVVQATVTEPGAARPRRRGPARRARRARGCRRRNRRGGGSRPRSAIVSPRDSAAARYGSGSRSGSIASARPSPRSTSKRSGR